MQSGRRAMEQSSSLLFRSLKSTDRASNKPGRLRQKGAFLIWIK
jgi:hypothetical protein